jgi:hypothetical protein
VWASHHEKLCSDGIVAPHGFAPLISSDLGVVLVAVLCVFRRSSMCRQVHRELTCNELRDLTTIVPANACQQRNYVGAYSRFRTEIRNKSLWEVLFPH